LTATFVGPDGDFDWTAPVVLELVETRTFSSRVVHLRYRVVAAA
jgi:hypothetical protein